MGITHVRALICALLFASALSAHEIGTTEVRVVFEKDGTWAVDVLTPRQALLRKLRGRLDETRLVESAHVTFGNVEVRPKLEIDGDVIRYRGEVPRDAGPFAWRFDLCYATYPLTIVTPHGSRREWVEGDARSAPFPLHRSLLPPTRADVFRQYLLLGFTHIVPHGLDHILFVIGMLLLARGLRPVLWQVTAFTAAHTVSLALTIYGVVTVPSRIVEPLIALSIAWIAIENVATTQPRPWRTALVFVFGLLHGLGFAGVLRELGLPRSETLTGLLAFNFGVELGQLTVIAAVWLLVMRWTQERTWYRRRVLVPASLAIAAAGLVWMVERIA